MTKRTKEGYKELTPKRKAFVRSKIDSPTASLVQHVKNAGYNVKDNRSAAVVGHDLMQKPEIIMALGQHSDLFESAITGTVRDWKDSETPRKREIALNAAMFGHDKVHGKSTVNVVQQSSVVNIAINLTGDGEASPAPDDEIIDLT